MRPRNDQVVLRGKKEDVTEGGIVLVGECKETLTVEFIGPDVEGLEVGDVVVVLDRRERIYDIPEHPDGIVCNQAAIIVVE